VNGWDFWAVVERVIGVAVPIPDPYGIELQRWRESFGDPLAAAIPTHITLLPPTPVDDSMTDEMEDHLRLVAESARPFVVRLRGTATFRPVSPVVFVALADGIGACEEVERRVRSGPLARQLGFPYHPHVTVAHDLPDEVLDRAFKELADYDARFSVTGFSLYQHGLDGVWRPQLEFPFGSGGPIPYPANSCPSRD
jgi:2'-5' RNA ligase